MSKDQIEKPNKHLPVCQLNYLGTIAQLSR